MPTVACEHLVLRSGAAEDSLCTSGLHLSHMCDHMRFVDSGVAVCASVYNFIRAQPVCTAGISRRA